MGREAEDSASPAAEKLILADDRRVTVFLQSLTHFPPFRMVYGHLMLGWLLGTLGLMTAGPPLPDVFVMSPKDCAALVRHVPEAGVAYTPGVDARGRPVVPADLTPSVAVPQDFSIDVLALRNGAGALLSAPTPGTGQAQRQTASGDTPPSTRTTGQAGNALVQQTGIGRIDVLADGRAYFNGQPLFDPWQQALADYCRQALARIR